MKLSYLALLLVTAGLLGAAADERARATLKDLKGVLLVVEDLSPDVKQDGLTKSSIQLDIELKLRLAGIQVLTPAECQSAPGKPRLYVNIQTMRLRSNLRLRSTPGYAYSIILNLEQDVILARDPSVTSTGTTWSTGASGFMSLSDIRGLRDEIKNEVDVFINAYLSVNPKK